MAQAVQRFLDGPARTTANTNGSPSQYERDESAEPTIASERGTGSHATALAWRSIGFGDTHFAAHKYSAAIDRYRTAARTAPQLADAFFRQGFVLLAMGRYDQAAETIKRGLRIDPRWAKSDFTLKKLYGSDDAAKNAHRDALVVAAAARPNDADLQFLLGVHLYFDGQTRRAAESFQRARQSPATRWIA